MATSSSARDSIRLAKASKKTAILSPLAVRSIRAASTAAVKAASQSAQSLTGYSPGSLVPVAGFSALNVVLATALRHSPRDPDLFDCHIYSVSVEVGTATCQAGLYKYASPPLL